MRLSFRLKLFVPLCLLRMGLTGLCVAFFYNRVHGNVKSQLASRMKDIGRVGQNLLSARHRTFIEQLDARTEVLARPLRTSLSRLGEWEGAARALEEARHYDREQALALRLLGRVYFELGRLEESEQTYVDAVRLDETNPGLQRELEAVRARRG